MLPRFLALLLEPTVARFVRALIDFSGSAVDELSFQVGDVIHVFGRPATGDVDDGWLEGELVPADHVNGDAWSYPRRGVFPSMLVEACEEETEATWRRRIEAVSKRPRTSHCPHLSYCHSTTHLPHISSV